MAEDTRGHAGHYNFHHEIICPSRSIISQHALFTFIDIEKGYGYISIYSFVLKLIYLFKRPHEMEGSLWLYFAIQRDFIVYFCQSFPSRILRESFITLGRRCWIIGLAGACLSANWYIRDDFYHFSPASARCSRLSVLQNMSAAALRLPYRLLHFLAPWFDALLLFLHARAAYHIIIISFSQKLGYTLRFYHLILLIAIFALLMRYFIEYFADDIGPNKILSMGHSLISPLLIWYDMIGCMSFISQDTPAWALLICHFPFGRAMPYR